jgi:hypothetical protein
MSTADRRLTDLLDSWQRSLTLHARYLELDDETYRGVQDWPPHQRPTRWVLELASSRLAALRQLHEERQRSGDPRFAEALELMGFLANLLGAEHIERFVPMAREGVQATAKTVKSPSALPIPVAAPESANAAVQRAPDPATPARTKKPETLTAAGSPRRASAGARRRRTPQKSSARPIPPAEPRTEELVIADAARFLSWGREWPAIAGLIARLANRPGEPEIWEILRRNRQAIEARAAKGSGSASRR